jgi:hypothetical protein
MSLPKLFALLQSYLPSVAAILATTLVGIAMAGALHDLTVFI